jgi:valyl-tRNA synthetase
VRTRLENASFVSQAPAAVVAGEQARAVELERMATGLKDQLARVRTLLQT